MLSITRSVARLVRATFRKVGDFESREKPTALRLQADASGLRLQARAGSVGAEFHLPGSLDADSLPLPIAALADFEGAGDSVVALTAEGDGKVRATWTDAGVPQRRSYEVPREPMPWLDAPPKLSSVDGTVLLAIKETMSTAADGRVRFALTHVLLRGSTSEAIGTDGRQLLVVRGVSFPWSDDVLVPRTRLLDAKFFSNAESLAVARIDDFVILRSGQWTAWLGINKSGRFPKYESIVPRDAGNATRLILSDEDAEFLTNSLPRLPGKNDAVSPITLHLNGTAVVRARDESGPTELVLRGSQVEGKEVVICTNRSYLRTAVQLGMREFRVADGQSPVVAETSRRLYLWMPLPAAGALGPSTDCLRIDSTGVNLSTNDHPTQPPRNRPTTMAERNNSNDENEIENADDVAVDPLQEADALRSQLRETLGRVNRLVHALKRQRKQAQLVRSTLASLKQLQDVA